MKKFVFIGIKLLFIALIFFVLWKPDVVGEYTGLEVLKKFEGITFSKLKEVFEQIDLRTAAKWLAFAAAIKLLGIFAGIVRWHLLLKGQEIKLPFWYLTKCWFMGRAIGLFLPGTVGLDGYRLVESAAYTGEVIKCTTVIAVEKVIGFVALGLLVFLTLPLGMRLFDFNYVILGVILTILFVFIATAFLLLLNPRIAQVLVAAVPTPALIRDKVNKLGMAVTAYSAHRGTLLLAVVMGLCVHLGICLMYFGTAMAISGGNSDLMLDILFASPLVIVASIIAPTVSGLGVREGVMAVLLGAQYGEAQSALFGHLGLWAGEFVPFVLSLPLLIFATRPNRQEFLAEMASVKEMTGEAGERKFYISPETLTYYRRNLISCIGAGLFGGMIAGALVGLAEASWHISTLKNFGEVTAYWWAPTVYGAVFSGLGLAVAAVLTFFYLLFDRFARTSTTFALSLGGSLGALTLVIGWFRYRRDVLGEHALSTSEYGVLAGAAVIVAFVAILVGGGVGRIARGWVSGVMLSVGAFAVLVGAGVGASVLMKPTVEPPAFTQDADATGPNIIVVAVDTLRANFLSIYNELALPKTPKITALTEDSVRFENMFAQSSWTKASFGAIFSGEYPESHGATGKVSALPDEVDTFAEVLRDGGYYTKGYSNNPNIASVFNYGQGFIDYVDLKPSLYFWAQPSSKKLVLYDILRKVVNVVYGKLGGLIRITDFYQPADSVTDTGLEWIDGDTRPEDTPFMLFVHYMDPHDPFRDPENPGKGFARVQMGNPDPDAQKKETPLQKILGQKPDTRTLKERMINAYSYEIEFMDTEVGRLLDGLRERGLYDDSLIIFTADHGEEFYEHGGWWHGLSLYDEQIAVPLLIKLPGNAHGGAVNPGIARHVDLAPTLARLTGLERSERWQGESLFDDELGPGNSLTTHGYAHLEFEGIELRAVRTEMFKLINSNEGNKRNYPPVELYDLGLDPEEQENLIGSDAESAYDEDLTRLSDVMVEMRGFITEGAAEPRVSLEGMEALEEELGAIGYLDGDSPDSP